MLVEAEDGEDALNKVKSAITHAEYPYPVWSDWHEIGGRWSGIFEGWEDVKDALCYGDNPILAEDVITKFIEYRTGQMKQYLSEINAKGFDLEKAVDEYSVDDDQFGDKAMTLWRIRKLGELLADHWNPDTAIYDLDQHTANLQYFRARVKEEPNKQFLVPVDFHF